MNKCSGCGIFIEKNDLCERCFRIKHYNDYKVVSKTNSDFIPILENINKTHGVIFSQRVMLKLIEKGKIPVRVNAPLFWYRTSNSGELSRARTNHENAMKYVNEKRQRLAPGKVFVGSSYDYALLSAHPQFSADYLIAPPQMARYIEVSTQIYHIYLKYIAPEDIHVMRKEVG